MKTKQQKQVNPNRMITTITEIFKSVLNKPALKNLGLTTVAITLAKTFRINAIGASLPIRATKKAREKRFARFIDSAFPTDAVMLQWHTFVLQRVCKDREKYATILIDETDLPHGFKALVAAVPFRCRAIPIYWQIYTNEQIRQMKYQSHNALIQAFCTTLYRETKAVLPNGCEPEFVFDRGFARAKYVIKFLDDAGIKFAMRVPKNGGFAGDGTVQTLKDICSTTLYPKIHYHRTEQIELCLYAIIDERFKEPMFLISNHQTTEYLHRVYQKRMQIEEGFRDLKSCIGFRSLNLKKVSQSRVSLLWLLAIITYGLLFLLYEKSGYRWADEWNNGSQKTYSLIEVIKRVVYEGWRDFCLDPFFVLTDVVTH